MPYRRGALAPAGERDERDPAHAAGEEELERVDGVLHHGLLVDAVAQPIEGLADEAGEGERRVERAAEVGPLDAERGELVGRVGHEVAPLAHVGRGAAQRGERALQRGERPVLGERRGRGHEPGGEVREDLARLHAVRADLVGDDEPAGAGTGRGAEHVHLRQPRERHHPVPPLGVGEGGVDEPADVVEPLVDRVVEDVAAVLDRDPHELLDEGARVDAAGRVVGVVQDDGGDPARSEEPRELLRVREELGRRRGQLDHPLARPLDEPVVLPARPRHDDSRAVLAEDLEHDGEPRARARREEDLVGLEAHDRVGVVEQPVAVEELGDLAPHVHPPDRRPIAVDGVAGDPLRGAHDLGVGLEVGVLVVALRQVQRALLLHSAREEADVGLGGRESAGGQRSRGVSGIRCCGLQASDSRTTSRPRAERLNLLSGRLRTAARIF